MLLVALAHLHDLDGLLLGILNFFPCLHKNNKKAPIIAQSSSREPNQERVYELRLSLSHGQYNLDSIDHVIAQSSQGKLVSFHNKHKLALVSENNSYETASQNLKISSLTQELKCDPSLNCQRAHEDLF